MADENEALFKEIEEELRQDKVYRLWKTYRYYIIFSVVALVASVTFYQIWKSYQTGQEERRGEAYNSLQALIRSEKVADALSGLRSFSTQKNDGYARLAKFSEAALLAETDGEAAVDIYRELSNDIYIAERYRHLAIILGALRQIENNIKSKDLIERLAEINTLTNPWRHSAREIIALNFLLSEDRKKAISLLEEIVNDATTPNSLKSRVEEFLKTIKQNL